MTIVSGNLANSTCEVLVSSDDYELSMGGGVSAAMMCKRVLASESYLGIIGMRYGHVDEGSSLSMTELEYQQAVKADKPLRIFVMSDDAPITANMVERDPPKLAKLNAFREGVLRRHSCRMFTDVADLAAKVKESLA